ncbi:hypothetical protein NMY22_g13580 [Coprinellus aureogranulatus]|nr:hypothetical protein NMY22_g13580 [Coprinellus aureogranulatus]
MQEWQNRRVEILIAFYCSTTTYTMIVCLHRERLRHPDTPNSSRQSFPQKKVLINVNAVKRRLKRAVPAVCKEDFSSVPGLNSLRTTMQRTPKHRTPRAGLYRTEDGIDSEEKREGEDDYAPVNPFEASLALGIQKILGKARDRTIDEVPVESVPLDGASKRTRRPVAPVKPPSTYPYPHLWPTSAGLPAYPYGYQMSDYPPTPDSFGGPDFQSYPPPNAFWGGPLPVPSRIPQTQDTPLGGQPSSSHQQPSYRPQYERPHRPVGWNRQDPAAENHRPPSPRSRRRDALRYGLRRADFPPKRSGVERSRSRERSGLSRLRDRRRSPSDTRHRDAPSKVPPRGPRNGPPRPANASKLVDLGGAPPKVPSMAFTSTSPHHRDLSWL